MELDSAFQASRWEILESLAYKSGSATDLSKKLGLSVPTISQQARLLEASGLLSVKKSSRKGVGKPKMRYQLEQEAAKVTVLKKGFAGQRAFNPSPMEAALLNILLWEYPEDHFFLAKYLVENQTLLSTALGVGIVDRSAGELHFLILGNEDDLEELKKQFPQHNMSSPFTNRKKSIINWVHSPEELQDGVGKEDNYYRKLVEKMHPLVDQKGVFRRLSS